MDASASTTQDFARRFVQRGVPETSYRPLGRTGLRVSLVGFGGYRVDDSDAGHRAALVAALESGINLIDTSTNYTDGGSERLVGAVLRQLEDEGRLRRDEVVVVSKVGYVQGGNLDLVQSREREGRPFPEVVRYANGCWHCIHPDFVRDQLGRSLERMGLQRVDAYLLHNPEYFLADAHQRGVPPEQARAEFDGRLRAAFGALEEEVEAGRIRGYGVSSNTLVVGDEDPEATCLARMLDLAAEAAAERGRGESAFQVVQLPMNLLEAGAALQRRDGAGRDRSVLAHAASRNVAVLANRPLNAFSAGRLLRLAESPERGGGDIAAAAQRVAALEAEFAEALGPALRAEGGPQAEELFHWGSDLGAASRRFSGLEHWRSVEEGFIRPRFEHVVAHLGLHLVGPARNFWAGWKERYVPALEGLLSAVGDHHRRTASRDTRRVKEAAAPHLPASLRGEALERQAIAAVAHAPGMTAVLEGMRRVEYVRDAEAVLRLPAFVTPEALWSATSATA